MARSEILDIFPAIFANFLADFVPPLSMEVIVVSLLFVAYHSFRVLLGLVSSEKYTEFFIYSSSQILFSLILTIGILDAFDASFATSDVFIIPLLLSLSLYYFLYMPLVLRNAKLFSVTTYRIVVSYCMMFILFGCVLYGIYRIGEAVGDAVVNDSMWLFDLEIITGSTDDY